MDTFSLTIPPDTVFRNKLVASLKHNAILTFAESQSTPLRESEGASSDVLAYIFSFPTVAVLVAALKYLSPALTEFIKNRQVTIKVGDTEINVANAKDLARAITAATDLPQSPQVTRSRKSKK